MQLHLKAQAADTTALKSESFALVVPSYENLLELPPPKAMLAKFPPGALVLLTDISTYPIVVSRGTVEAVFIDLSPEKLTREYVFCVRHDNDETTTMAVETQLQWAPHCPVWLKSLPNGESKSATVIGSCQEFVDSKPLYSVQVPDGTGIFHGVGADNLCYRPTDVSVPAAVKQETSLFVSSTNSGTSTNGGNAPAKRFLLSTNADCCQAPPSKKSKSLTILPTMPAIEGRQAVKSHEVSSVYESASTPSASSSAAGTHDDEVCTIKLPNFADPARLRGKPSLN